MASQFPKQEYLNVNVLLVEDYYIATIILQAVHVVCGVKVG